MHFSWANCVCYLQINVFKIYEPDGIAARYHIRKMRQSRADILCGSPLIELIIQLVFEPTAKL